MPPPETFERNQKAVYWAKTGVSAHNEPVLDEPIELDVRWQNKKTQRTIREGKPVVFDAEVVLDRVVPIGSLLWEGTLDDWYGVGSAGDETNLMQVEELEQVPDEKGRVVRRTACLIRFRRRPA